ncbi:hypothetical protein NDN08_001070 [Rhodosorus marinus]|uniref:DNA polymerase V n=1 Tax=Rhodosorus marinus TaxID=101924 RepID=A0AAV8UTY3_9RHOD|nr:hypothetical protein NDN08_001070 [Rhodosorus marinus]
MARPSERILNVLSSLNTQEREQRISKAKVLGEESTAYVQKRLVRGTASSNGSAREAFSLALVSVLKNDPESVQSVKSLIDAELIGKGGRREEREATLGRLFCIAAFLRSKTLDSSSELVKWAIGELFKAAETERGLSDLALFLAVQMRLTVPANAVVEKQCSAWATKRDTADGAAMKILLEQADPVDVGPSLMTWFDNGFIMPKAPYCWILSVQQSARRGALDKFWLKVVENRLLRSSAAEKRKLGLRLVPTALALAKTATNVETILTKRTVLQLANAKVTADELVAAIGETAPKALPSIASTFGRLGGFGAALVAAVERMNSDEEAALIRRTREWEQVKAVSTLSAIWKARKSFHEDVAKELSARDATTSVIQLAAEFGPSTLIDLYNLLSDMTEMKYIDSDTAREENAKNLIAGSGRLCGEELDENNSIMQSIADLLQLESATMRSVAVLAFNEIMRQITFEDLQPLFELLDEPISDDEEDDAEEEELSEDEDEESEGGSSSEDGDEAEGDGQVEETNSLERVESEAEEEEENRSMSDIDMDDEDPEVLARYDQMLGSVVKEATLSERQQRKRDLEARTHVRSKALDLLAKYITATRKTKKGLENILLLIPLLLDVSMMQDRTSSDKAEGLLIKKVLRSPAEFSSCNSERVLEVLKMSMDKVLLPEARKAVHQCERAVSFLLTVALRSGVQRSLVSAEFERGWTTFASARKDLGLGREFGELVSSSNPSVVLDCFDSILDTAVDGKTPFVQGIALQTLAATLKSAPRNEESILDPSKCTAAEEAIAKIARKDGSNFKAARVRDVLALCSVLTELEYMGKNARAIGDSLQAMSSWQVVQNNGGLRNIVEQLEERLGEGTADGDEEEGARKRKSKASGAGDRKSQRRK